MVNILTTDWQTHTPFILALPSRRHFTSHQGSPSFIKVKMKVTQSCPTLCNPMDYTVHGILQARILEWVAFPFSRGSSQPRDQTQVSRIAGRLFTSWATREAITHKRSHQTFLPPSPGLWLSARLANLAPEELKMSRVVCVNDGFLQGEIGLKFQAHMRENCCSNFAS